MGRTIRGRAFHEDWIVVKDGDVYDDCLFEDCVVQTVRGPGAATITNSQFFGCTFIGSWPAAFSLSGQRRATRSDEPEVIEARMAKSIRPASRPRRRWFNLGRKRK